GQGHTGRRTRLPSVRRRSRSWPTSLAGRAWTLEDHAGVVQAGDEGRAIDLLRAAGSVAEADDVRAMLLESGFKGEPFGPVNQRDISGVAIRIISHQDGELPAGIQRSGTVLDELPIPPQEMFESR